MTAALLALCLLGQVDYPTLFLAAPRDAQFRGPTSFSAGSNGPFEYDPRQQLILRQTDGTERVIAETVLDYCMSLDGTQIYYSQIHTAGKYADIFRVPLAGGEPVKLTDAASEWRPPTGVYPAGSDGPVWNTAPCDTPEGIVFTSSRDNITPPGDPFIGFMLYRMDHDGSNVEKIGAMNLGGVLHPSYYDGRVYFSTNETQGHRGGLGNGWAIWSIKSDGTDWQPEFTQAGDVDDGWHISTHTSDGTLVADEYYDTRRVGKLSAAPRVSAAPHGPQSKFGKPVKTQNPWTWGGWDVGQGRVRSGNFYQYPFQRVGAFNPLPMFHRQDKLNTTGTDPVYYQREVGHPSGGPGNSLLVSWTGDDPVGRQWGIYVIGNIAEHKHYPPPDTRPVTGLSDRPLDYFTKVVDLPDRHEWFGRAAVSYQAIYGSPPPAMTPSPVATELPEGTPYGIVGSSNINWRELLSADGKSLVTFANEDVAAIRILHFNPTQASRRIHSPQFTRISNGGRDGFEGFSSAMNELAGFYEQPVPINTDGSIKFAVPADQPWTFQLIDHNGMALPRGTAQTWHHVRPGERRVDCNGCHAHHQPAPERFEDTIAGQPDYQFVKLTKVKTIVYERDLAPLDTHGFGPRPWAVSGGPKHYQSKLWAAIQTLPDAERRLWAAWADTGFPATNGEARVTPESGHGPYSDKVPPTVAPTFRTDKTLIGVADPDSGVNYESLSVIADGQERASEFTRNGDIFHGPPLTGEVTVSIRDNQHATGAEQGNLTSITRRVTPIEPPVEPPPPNPNQPRIDEIEARLAEIDAEIEGLEAERRALEEELEELQ
jgi:hypothetical protein